MGSEGCLATFKTRDSRRRLDEADAHQRRQLGGVEDGGWHDRSCDLTPDADRRPRGGGGGAENRRRLGCASNQPYGCPDAAHSTVIPRCTCEVAAAPLGPCDDGDIGLNGVLAAAREGAPEECWDFVPYMATWSGRTEQQLCAATLGELAQFLWAIGAAPWAPDDGTKTIAEVCPARCGLEGAGACAAELAPKCESTKALGEASAFPDLAGSGGRRKLGCFAPIAKKYAGLKCSGTTDAAPTKTLLEEFLVSTADELYAAVAAAGAKTTEDNCRWSAAKPTPAALADGAVNGAVRTGNAYQLSAQSTARRRR